jgi:hypothetical protein
VFALGDPRLYDDDVHYQDQEACARNVSKTPPDPARE